MNINNYGKYRLGLTEDEIKCYIVTKALGIEIKSYFIEDCEYLISLFYELGNFTKFYREDNLLLLDREEVDQVINIILGR